MNFTANIYIYIMYSKCVSIGIYFLVISFSLNNLKDLLARDYGWHDINIFIINHHDRQSAQTSSQLSSLVSFPVYQDTPQLHLWRDVFEGTKDDFFVFDRFKTSFKFHPTLIVLFLKQIKFFYKF